MAKKKKEEQTTLFQEEKEPETVEAVGSFEPLVLTSRPELLRKYRVSAPDWHPKEGFAVDESEAIRTYLVSCGNSSAIITPTFKVTLVE